MAADTAFEDPASLSLLACSRSRRVTVRRRVLGSGAKAESAGRTVIAVDPRHTSQRCAECGHVAAGRACPSGGLKLPEKPLLQRAEESRRHIVVSALCS